MSHLKRIKRDLTACTASDIEEVIVALKAARNALKHSRAMKTFDAWFNRVNVSQLTLALYIEVLSLKKALSIVQVRATLQDAMQVISEVQCQGWRVPASDLRHDDTAHPAGA